MTKWLFSWVIGFVFVLIAIAWNDAKNSNVEQTKGLREDIRTLQQLMMRAERRLEQNQAVQIGHARHDFPEKEYLRTSEYAIQQQISADEVRDRIVKGEIDGVVRTPGGHARIPNPMFVGIRVNPGGSQDNPGIQ